MSLVVGGRYVCWGGGWGGAGSGNAPFWAHPLPKGVNIPNGPQRRGQGGGKDTHVNATQTTPHITYANGQQQFSSTLPHSPLSIPRPRETTVPPQPPGGRTPPQTTTSDQRQMGRYCAQVMAGDLIAVGCQRLWDRR